MTLSCLGSPSVFYHYDIEKHNDHHDTSIIGDLG